MSGCCEHGDAVKKEVPEVSADKLVGAVVSKFKVSGMDCADEVAAVQNALAVTGVIKVDANLMAETVSVSHDKTVSEDRIKTLIEKAGLKVIEDKRLSFFEEQSQRIKLVGLSGVFLGIGLVLDWRDFSGNVTLGLFLLSIVLSGKIIFPKALRSLTKFHLDMNVLMTVAVVGAIFIKEYSEAASVVFLFSLAELLEAMSVARARNAIREVLKVAPKDALILDESGKTISIPVTELKIGNTVIVRPGDNIPIDGSILDGTSSVNEASLTGESRAVEKKSGDKVLAGTINESGVLRVKVEKDFKDTKISQIISMIEDAQKEKAPSQRFVDKFASIYTPAVLILAFFVAIIPPLFFEGDWQSWIYKSLVLLVIGCPCALVIATPVSVVSGLTSLAKRGILVKGGIYLETLGKLKAIALDKTGTITNGKPEVKELKLFSNVPENEVIRLAAGLESMSSHPLALAVLKYAKERNISYPHPEEFKIITGKGAEGVIEGHPYFVGNHNLGHELGICGPEIEAYLDTVENQSMSVIVVGHRPHDNCKGEIIGIFALGDTIRSGIETIIQDFHDVGIQTVAMISGDNQKTVSAVAKKVGIDYAKGGLLPDDKVREIKELVAKYKYVGMVGDGVNDAPALANASIGFAMGVVGSDTAIETADVALMKDDLSMLPKAIKHGKQVLSVIRFNIGFAIAIKVVFFILTFMGMTNLWLAVAADMGASLLVTFNALRLLKIKKA